MANPVSAFFASPVLVFTAAFLLRAVLLVYGLWQDAHSPLKYTDIDYLVFTDAARFTFSPASSSSSSLLSSGGDHLVPPPAPPAAWGSPYARATYRYTPLLAYLLYPTTRPGLAWFASGKVLFAGADLLAGALLVAMLRARPEPGPGPGRQTPLGTAAALRYASIWLLNPMVAAISTRGSSEGLLGALVAALLWAVLARRAALAGLLLGLGVHFKIYPFIYAPAIVWWMEDDHRQGAPAPSSRGPLARLLRLLTPARLTLALVSLATFAALNLAMYALYGDDFVQHTFLHHVTRIDHRHNFSPYNVLLYLASARGDDAAPAGVRIESVAFVPQLLLSCVLIPLVGAKKDLPTTMLAQTFAFVTFNKVCTSQYFLWYMVFLPLYLPSSSLMAKPALGGTALALWVATQGAWLQQAYNLEFLGQSTFVPGLWWASLAFFLVNCWILGIIIGDLADKGRRPRAQSIAKRRNS